MSEILRIIDELRREHEGDPWHGSPLRAILDGITHQQAASRPIPAAHSIWELVLHMTAWKGEVSRRLGGNAAREPEEGDWPGVGHPTPERWSAALDRLETVHQQLMAAIREFPESMLFAPTNDPRDRAMGTGVEYYVLLHGIVQHDVYHAGQIALLKKGLS